MKTVGPGSLFFLEIRVLLVDDLTLCGESVRCAGKESNSFTLPRVLGACSLRVLAQLAVQSDDHSFNYHVASTGPYRVVGFLLRILCAIVHNN